MRQLTIFMTWIIAVGSAVAQQDGVAPDSRVAQNSPSGDAAQTAIHDSLRELRDRMFAAYEKQDLDALLKDVVVEVGAGRGEAGATLLAARVDAQIARIQRAGRLPMGGRSR